VFFVTAKGVKVLRGKAREFSKIFGDSHRMQMEAEDGVV